jgi:gliding motility-associated protein GldE
MMVSGAKLALFSLSFKDINLLKTKQRPVEKQIMKMLEQPRLLLASLQVAHTFFNLIIIIICNVLVNDRLVESGSHFLLILFIKILVISFLLLLFTESLPRAWAAQQNLRFAFNSAFIVSAVFSLFKGPAKWLLGFTEGVNKTLGADKSHSYTLEQLDHAIDLTTAQDATQEEKNMLKGIIKFGNITVRQVMRSRLDVHGVEAGTSFGDLVKKVEELHYSRLPVFQGSLDHVTGIIHTKDLIPHLSQPPDYDWQHLIRQPYFVHENKFIEDLLQEFQSKRIHFAVVVDEFGGTEGIVTLEDILEEIIGDIRDEFDEEESSFTRIDENTFVFEGKTLISEACTKMSLPTDTFEKVQGDSETMAGLLMELAGEIPTKDQEITIGDFQFTVLETEKNRIQKIKVVITPSSPQE